MLRSPPRIALVLLASLAGLLIAGGLAHGEPAATSPSSPSASADADCLAKPNAPSAPGNHWYYRLDRASGRRCWYQRAATGTANETAQSRPSTRAIAAPIDKPVPESPADRPSAARDRDLDQTAVEPAAAALAQPYSWSTAAPPAPPQQVTPAENDIATPAPAVAPQTGVVAEPPRIAPAPVTPARLPIAERSAAAAADGAHMPALFGAALALVFIVLGSIVARLGARLIRARRRNGVAREAASMAPPVLGEQDTPGLVPPMPLEDDITRAAPPSWMTRRAPAAQPDGATFPDDAVRHNRDARELEQNVRELLHRMRSDLQRTPGASAAAQSRSPEELDELLAAWRGGRRRRLPG